MVLHLLKKCLRKKFKRDFNFDSSWEAMKEAKTIFIVAGAGWSTLLFIIALQYCFYTNKIRMWLFECFEKSFIWKSHFKIFPVCVKSIGMTNWISETVEMKKKTSEINDETPIKSTNKQDNVKRPKSLLLSLWIN